jgi:DNA-binding response OmpR family regulator
MARHRILLAHGNADCRKIYGSVLSYGGYDVDTASDMSSALAQIAGASYDLVLTDLYLECEQDECLIRVIRGSPSTAHLPVVVLTGWTTDPHRKLALDQCAERFLALPVRPRELAAIVSEVLGNPTRARLPSLPTAGRADRPMANGL